jgi:hypothetical protein
MITTEVENIPRIWDDARDIRCFRIIARLFSPDFCLGASVLLASNDDKVNTVQPTPAEGRTSATAPAGVNRHARPERDVIPVRVRRTR